MSPLPPRAVTRPANPSPRRGGVEPIADARLPADIDPTRYARMILRRVGIAPLIGLIVAAFAAPLPSPAAAQVTAVSTARVVIVSDQARQRDLRNDEREGRRAASDMTVAQRQRPCDAQRVVDAHTGATRAPALCRYVIFDLP